MLRTAVFVSMAMMLRWNGSSITLPHTGAGVLSIADAIDDLFKASGAMKLLRFHSGIKRLAFELALRDHTAPSDAVTIPGHRLGEIRVPLISNFSDEGPSFKRRPSQEQIDRLSEIIGKQLRWWLDYEDPRTYGY